MYLRVLLSDITLFCMDRCSLNIRRASGRQPFQVSGGFPIDGTMAVCIWHCTPSKHCNSFAHLRTNLAHLCNHSVRFCTKSLHSIALSLHNLCNYSVHLCTISFALRVHIVAPVLNIFAHEVLSSLWHMSRHWWLALYVSSPRRA